MYYDIDKFITNRFMVGFGNFTSIHLITSLPDKLPSRQSTVKFLVLKLGTVFDSYSKSRMINFQ